MPGQQAVGDHAKVAEHHTEVLHQRGGGAQHLLVVQRDGAHQRVALLDDRRVQRARRDVDHLVAQQTLGADTRFRVGADLFAHRAIDGQGDQQHVIGVPTLVHRHEIDPLDLPYVLAGQSHAGALDQAVGAGHQGDQFISLAKYRARFADEKDRYDQHPDGDRDGQPHADLIPGYL